MDCVKWQKCKNEEVKKRLTEYLKQRNKIAHGQKISITKQNVKQLKNYVEILAKKLDEQIAVKAKQSTGQVPW
jgi:hypothetical protein